MPVNGLNSGIDFKFSFVDRNGVLNIELLESVTMKEDASVAKEIQINGLVLHPKFHVGWSGALVTQRHSDVLDAYFAAQEANYYAGIDQFPGTITETITETDGSITQWQYTNVVLVLEDAGEWSGTAIVKQRCSVYASRKLQLA